MERRFTGPTAFQQFTEFLATRPAAARLAMHESGAIAADVLYENVVRTFGDVNRLAPLAPSTQAERAAAGYDPNHPLFRTGATLLSKVEKAHGPAVGAVGTSEPIQKYHELGYVDARGGVSVPPRPVFRIGIEASVPDLLAISEAICGVALGAEPTLKRAFLTVRSRSGAFNPKGVTPKREG